MFNYRQLSQELDKLVHEGLESQFSKILESPKLKDMDNIMSLSGNMRDEVTRLTQSITQKRQLLIDLEKAFDKPLDA